MKARGSLFMFLYLFLNIHKNTHLCFFRSYENTESFMTLWTCKNVVISAHLAMKEKTTGVKQTLFVLDPVPLGPCRSFLCFNRYPALKLRPLIVPNELEKGSVTVSFINPACLQRFLSWFNAIEDKFDVDLNPEVCILILCPFYSLHHSSLLQLSENQRSIISGTVISH